MYTGQVNTQRKLYRNSLYWHPWGKSYPYTVMVATRSYMHVNDAASAFDVILHKGELLHIYNIGAHEERTVLSVAHDICSNVGRDSKEAIVHVRDRAFNDRRYFIDCSKLLALGWKQRKSWEQGLKETVQWYCTEDLSSYWEQYATALEAHPLQVGRCLTFSRENSSVSFCTDTNGTVGASKETF